MLLPSPLPLHTRSLSLSNKLGAGGNGVFKKPWSSYSSSRLIVVVGAVDEGSKQQQFEVDPDKAREALKNLDQQFQSRSRKQVRPPVKEAPYVNLSRDQIRDDEAVEFSGSFFTYTAVALFAFTIFYNVFFYTVIVPSVDGPYETPTTIVARDIPK